MDGFKYEQTSAQKQPRAIVSKSIDEGLIPRSIRSLFDLVNQKKE